MLRLPLSALALLTALPAVLLVGSTTARAAAPALTADCAALRASEAGTVTSSVGVQVSGTYSAGEQIRITPTGTSPVVTIQTPGGPTTVAAVSGEPVRYDVTATGVHEFVVTASGPVSLTLTCGIPPTVAITEPGPGSSYFVRDIVIPQFACEAGSNPVDSCENEFVDTSSAGERDLTVVATDTSGLRSSRTVGYSVGKRPQTVGFTGEPPADQKWGRNPLFVEATATSGLPVTVSVDPASTGCGGTPGEASPFVLVSLYRGGTCILHLDQAGDDQFEPAERVTHTFQALNQDCWVLPVKASKGLLGLTPTTFRAELEVVSWFGPSQVVWGYVGQPITFSVGGKPVCTANTVLVPSENPFDLTTVATCKATIGLPAALKHSSFTASYAGNEFYLPSSGTAKLQ